LEKSFDMAQPDSTTIKELIVDQNGVVFFRLYDWRNGKPMNVSGTFISSMWIGEASMENEASRSALRILLRSMADELEHRQIRRDSAPW
jgi:hypothetical protein